MKLSHLALGALTLALLAAAAFERRTAAVAAPAPTLPISLPAMPQAHTAAAVPPKLEHSDPSAPVDRETMRHEIEDRIQSSGGPASWSAPARRAFDDWLAAAGDRVLSSAIDCHRDGCIARLRYRDQAALDAATAAFEQRIDAWPGPKMKTPPHEDAGAITNEWILLPPDEMRRP